MIVAIDGPAGSGKSTVARALAAREGFVYLDTGAMYRAVTLKVLKAQVPVTETARVAKLAQEAVIEFVPGAPGEAPQVMLDGKDVTAAIRTAQIDQNVSAVASVPAVRQAMVAQQRAIAKNIDIVAEGRDMGTVVFPDAQVKVFLSADAAARAWRRTIEREGGNAAQPGAQVKDQALYESVLEDIQSRDAQDEANAASPLYPAADATLLDSTRMAPQQVVDAIANLVALAQARQAAIASDNAAASQPSAAEKDAPSQPASTQAAPGASGSDATKAKDAGATGAKAPKTKSGQAPMRPFHNTFDDYYDHGMREFPLPARCVFNVAAGLIYGFSRLYWPWDYEGGQQLIDELKERELGTVMVMNHVSMVEPVITVVMFWRQGLRIRPVFKQEFNKNDLMRWVFSRVGGIPVDRGTADLKAVRRCQRALKRGESILIYPEGTRIRDDDGKAPIHGGFALIAQMAKTDVTPSAVIGVRDVTPEGAHIPRPHRVHFKVGAPLKFGALGVKGRKAQLEAMEAKAMDKVFELRAQLRRDYPGKW